LTCRTVCTFRVPLGYPEARKREKKGKKKKKKKKKNLKLKIRDLFYSPDFGSGSDKKRKISKVEIEDVTFVKPGINGRIISKVPFINQ